jgi:hypothetical protein
MAVVRRSARGDQWEDQWRIKLLGRTGRGTSATWQGLMAAKGLTSTPPPGRADRQPLPRGRRGLELVCRRCRYRPPVSRRDVYQLVDQAAATGRRDVYLD